MNIDNILHRVIKEGIDKNIKTLELEEDCTSAYTNIATILRELVIYIRNDINNAKSIGGTITMVEIQKFLTVLENLINNSLSQVTKQRVEIILTAKMD